MNASWTLISTPVDSSSMVFLFSYWPHPQIHTYNYRESACPPWFGFLVPCTDLSYSTSCNIFFFSFAFVRSLSSPPVHDMQQILTGCKAYCLLESDWLFSWLQHRWSAHDYSVLETVKLCERSYVRKINWRTKYIVWWFHLIKKVYISSVCVDSSITNVWQMC